MQMHDMDSQDMGLDAADPKFLIPIGSVLQPALAAVNIPPFDKKKSAYVQVTELFNNIREDVGQNGILLEHMYNLLASQVAAPISVMINQLNSAVHGTNNGGIQEFSAVNHSNPPCSKRFKAFYEKSAPAKSGKRLVPYTVIKKGLESHFFFNLCVYNLYTFLSFKNIFL